jgi:hypothetical protein
MTTPFKPLVVGAPRSGFALLASVVIHFVPLGPSKLDLRQRILNAMMRHLGDHISTSIVDAFARKGIREDLLYNPNFRYVVGGPKWIRPDAPETACFRKYIGVRGMGDFTLITSHPRQMLDMDEIVHSHNDPGLWLEHPGYRDYTKYASVRNPIGILNSSIFSLNALSSEYIQKFVPPELDNHQLREQLALYKFTDLDFYEGLVRFLAPYLQEFLKHQHGYTVMRWEDLITDPVPTIQRLGKASGFDISDSFARNLWSRLDHVNLTQAHKHNYRSGKGVVGDWKNWVTNEHLELARKHGLEEISVALGYGKFEFFDEKSYTPFQQTVSDHIRRGEIHRDFFDPDLFTFAFNKSNLVSDKFPFRRHDWREHTQIERSIFKDEALELHIWDIAERATAEVNSFIADFLDGSYGSRRDALRSLHQLRRQHKALIGAADPVRFEEAFRAADRELASPASLRSLYRRLSSTAKRIIRRLRPAAGGQPASADGPENLPRLMESIKGYNIVFFDGVYFGLPQSLGPVKLEAARTKQMPGVLTGTTLESVRDAIIQNAESPPH